MENPNDPNGEEALLIYPIGDFDDKPEDLIKFHGLSPMPVHPTGFLYEKALTTITLFKLNDIVERKNLFLERARILIALYTSLNNNIQGLIEGFTSPKSPHTNCALSFKKLFETNPQKAEDIFELCVELMVKNS